MGIFDKAKDLISENADKVSQGIDKAGDMLDAKTGGKHAGHVDAAQEEARRRVEQLRRENEQSAGAPVDRPGTNPPPA